MRSSGCQRPRESLSVASDPESAEVMRFQPAPPAVGMERDREPGAPKVHLAHHPTALPWAPGRVPRWGGCVWGRGFPTALPGTVATGLTGPICARPFWAHRRCISLASPRHRRGEIGPLNAFSPEGAYPVALFRTKGAPRRTQRHAYAETRGIRPQMLASGDAPFASQCIAAPQPCWTPIQRTPHNRSANQIVQTRFLEF